MFLIAGLGNFGQEYTDTRHNAGFLTLDFLLDSDETWKESKKNKYLFLKKNFLNAKVVFIKPLTLMNNSGLAIQKAAHYFKVAPQNIIVIHDELDLPFGTWRVRPKGSSAGHKGIASIIKELGQPNFWRIRIGISNDLAKKMPPEKFVLQKFSKTEWQTLHKEIFTELEKELKKMRL